MTDAEGLDEGPSVPDGPRRGGPTARKEPRPMCSRPGVDVHGSTDSCPSTSMSDHDTVWVRLGVQGPVTVSHVLTGTVTSGHLSNGDGERPSNPTPLSSGTVAVELKTIFVRPSTPARLSLGGSDYNRGGTSVLSGRTSSAGERPGLPEGPQVDSSSDRYPSKGSSQVVGLTKNRKKGKTLK